MTQLEPKDRKDQAALIYLTQPYRFWAHLSQRMVWSDTHQPHYLRLLLPFAACSLTCVLLMIPLFFAVQRWLLASGTPLSLLWMGILAALVLLAYLNVVWSLPDLYQLYGRLRNQPVERHRFWSILTTPLRTQEPTSHYLVYGLLIAALIAFVILG